MAYKFQLGKAKLSGSIETAQAITSQGGLTVNGDVDLDAGVINNAELQNSSVQFNGVTVALGATGSFGTDAVTEGSTNRYYLDSRARAAVSVTDAGGDGSLSYDNSTGVITYTGPSASEVRAHLSAGDGLSFAGGQFAVTSSIAGAGLAFAAGVLSVDTAEIAAGLSGSIRAAVADFVEGSDFVTFDDGTGTIGVDAAKFSGSFGAALASKSTTDLAEGANKYYTDARARAAVSAVDGGGDGSFSYDSSTGAFTYTGPSAAEARAHFSALTGAAYQNGNISYNSATGQVTLQPVEESWVRQRLGASDFVTYANATGIVGINGGNFTGSARNTVGVAASSGLSYNKSVGEFAVSSSIAGEALELASGVLNVKFDNSSIESSGDALRVKSSGITNAMLAGSIENSKLVNSSVTINGTAGEVTVVGGGSLALGGTATVSLPSTISKNLTFSGQVTMENLIVTGSLTTVNSTNLEIKDARILMASGSTGWATDVGFDFGSHVGHATLLTAEVNIDGSGGAENVLSSSLPLVAPSMKADTFYGNFVGASILGIVTEGGSTATISANVTRANNAAQVLTLPSAPAVGQEHRIKCVVADASNPVITIQPASGAKLEGVVDAQITLESFGAAVSLVWGGSSEGWMVF
jgi:hypothetical protein